MNAPPAEFDRKCQADRTAAGDQNVGIDTMPI
jgi:hypothetical protein